MKCCTEKLFKTKKIVANSAIANFWNQRINYQERECSTFAKEASRKTESVSDFAARLHAQGRNVSSTHLRIRLVDLARMILIAAICDETHDKTLEKEMFSICPRGSDRSC